jgi:surface polysaccharide O-acyltransferase-like enzyme
MSKNRELTFIEVARAVAIFFVVMIPPIGRLADEANPDTVAISTFICFAVPLFLLVSGYLLG